MVILIREMPQNPNHLRNIQSHGEIFKFMTDEMLNEFLWRAESTTNLLGQHVENALHMSGYTTLSVKTKVNNRGVYINVKENNIKKLHISFHLKKITQPQAPGAIHVGDNSQIPTQYQLLYIISVPDICNPSKINHIQFTKGSFEPNTISNICGNLEPTIQRILDVLNLYFGPSNEPLSLIHNISGIFQPHRELMPIIRTRPTNLVRTSLTAHLKGGYSTNVHARRSRRRTRNNRGITKHVQTYKRINRKSR